jgi:outer membrane protein OmpA-like peptidoglycan-associated protein
MDWANGVYRGEPRVEELHAKVVRLRQEVAAAEPVDTTAKMRVAAATDALSRAETKAAEAENAVSEYIKSQASAFKEDARMATKVDAATAEVDQARHRLQELEQPTAQNAWDGSANAKALGALTDRDLNEVRKFGKPPHVVRRALELVQAMLAVADGTESLPPSGTGDVQWAELQRMLARDDFIRQMLTLKPAALSARPHLLTEIGERWPSLQEAVGTKAVPHDRGGWRAIAKAASSTRGGGGDGRGGGMRAAAPAAAAAKENTGMSDAQQVAAPPSSAKSSGGARGASTAGRTGRFAAAVAAAAAESDAAAVSRGEKQPAALGLSSLTIEAVEYASRPCGAIFRHCANVAAAALALALERARAQAVLEAAIQRLAGVSGERAATQAYLQSCVEEKHRREEVVTAAQAAVAAANDARLDAKVAASMAATALDGLRKSLEEAERLLSSAIEAVERRRERDAKWREGQAERDEAARRAAQAEIERDLASRTARPPAAWLHEHHIKEDLSAVAIEFATVSASLPADASNSLAKIASELRSSVTLRLHIAGHVQPDEDARLASQRAMNVGGLLIALGVLPLQLRAKGYGARAPIGPGEKRRLGLKSLRRVTLHALAEVRTRTPCEFGPGELAPLESEAVREMVRAVAALMQLDEHKEVRLSVEGHSDDHGSAAENVRISLARANAVCRQLEGLGVDQARLVPHGFGAAFPIDDNGTEDGRQHNRRVEFLVIPTCFAAAVRSDATAASTGGRGMGEGLSSHLSNRPGVAKVLRLF